ncbi:hypothetical protein [Candidatus Amarobacter glycogenicus]|uniref:TerC family protein n=1 Tax=Candidatus Amarobacter glycogenicus TaxID=3140699 RepID=UPI0031CCD254
MPSGLASPSPSTSGSHIFRGTEDGLEWTTGYLVEKTLSVDNIFIILLIFRLRRPQAYQHRVLFWSIVGGLSRAASSRSQESC